VVWSTFNSELPWKAHSNHRVSHSNIQQAVQKNSYKIFKVDCWTSC